MTVLTKRLLGIGMTSGLLMLLTMLFLRGGTASAASLSGGANQGVAKYTLQLCVSENNGQLICPSGINVHAQSGTTKPVVSNGNPVTITLSGTTYVVTDPSAIQNHWLDVTVPANLNLDLQVPNGTIQIDGVTGQMQLATESGTIIITNSTLAGTSTVSATNGSLQLDGKLEPLSQSSFTAVDGSIQVTLPKGTKLHLHAQALQSGNLTGNFSGLPNNAPSSFDGYLNTFAGDPDVANLSFTVTNGSLSLDQK